MFCPLIYVDSGYLDLTAENHATRIISAGFLIEFCDWRGCDFDFIPVNKLPTVTPSVPGKVNSFYPADTDVAVRFAIDIYPILANLNCSMPAIHQSNPGKDGDATHNIDEHPETHFVTAYPDDINRVPVR